MFSYLEGYTSVNVSIPNRSGDQGSIIDIPIQISDVTGKGIYSVGIKLQFNSSVLETKELNIAGSLMSSWGAPIVNIQPGQITIGAAGVSPLSGSGTLLFIKFEVKGTPGSSTTIQFIEMVFNEGEPNATTTDGYFSVNIVSIPVTLNVEGSSSQHGSPNPSYGTHQYNQGQTVNASVSSPADESSGTRYRCTSFTGTGSAPSGSGTSTSFTINQNSTLTWNWVIQYKLQASSAGNGSVSTSGTNWYDSGTGITLNATPNPGYDVNYWTVNGTQTGVGQSSLNVTMNEPKTVVVNFKPVSQPVTLTVKGSPSQRGSPTPAYGTHQYNQGQNVNASVSSPADESGGTRYRCTGFAGTGSAPSGSGTSTSFTINQNSTLTWNWVTQYKLQASSAGNGSVSPSGTNWYDSGQNVTLTATPNPNYHVEYWTVNGTQTGAGESSINVTINESKVVVVNFIQSSEPRVARPNNVTASQDTYTDKVRITWSIPNLYTTHFRVYRSLINTSSTSNAISNWQPGDFFDDFSAIPGRTYYYWVKAAADNSGSRESEFSDSPGGWRKLSPPTNVNASDGVYNDKVRITWDASYGATLYRVFRNAINNQSSALALGVDWQSSTVYDDYETISNQLYYYWVKAAHNTHDIIYNWHESVYSSPANTGYSPVVDDDINDGLPKNFVLYQNYPNPFNSETIIQYQLPRGSHVVIKVFNQSGHEIKTLVDEESPPGHFTIYWDGKDRFNRDVPSGIYLYMIKAGDFEESRKMLVIR